MSIRTLWIVSSLNPDWEVSPDGFIRRVDGGRPISVRTTMSVNGQQYRQVTLRIKDSGKKTTVPVSHFVLDAHGSPRPSSKHVAVHLSGDTMDDSIENLEWMSRSDSVHHSTTQRHGQVDAKKVLRKGSRTKHDDKKVREICRDLLVTGSTYREIAARHEVSKSFVTQLATGRTRIEIAIQEGLVLDNANMVTHAWARLSPKTRKAILELVAKDLSETD